MVGWGATVAGGVDATVVDVGATVVAVVVVSWAVVAAPVATVVVVLGSMVVLVVVASATTALNARGWAVVVVGSIGFAWLRAGATATPIVAATTPARKSPRSAAASPAN